MKLKRKEEKQKKHRNGRMSPGVELLSIIKDAYYGDNDDYEDVYNVDGEMDSGKRVTLTARGKTLQIENF